MKKKTSTKKYRKQRLTYPKSLFLHFKKSSSSSWRVKSYEFTILKRYSFQIKIRRFKTSPSNRSKKIKQHVLRIKILRIREIVFCFRYKKKIKSKLSKKQNIILRLANAVFIVGLIGIAIFGFQISGIGKPNPPIVNSYAETPVVIEDKPEQKKEYLPSSAPTHIDIPSINVNANVQNVGLLPSGALETPGVLSNLVGWYKNGPTPGELGPAVLVGHVDSYKGPSIFWELGKLNAGDIISIAREDGTTVKFKVTKKVQYDQNNFGTDEVYGNIDHAGLRVITCGGTFNHVTGRYTQNTVIFATIVI